MRKLFRSTLLLSIFLACATGAYADTFDFKAMANPGGAYGESAWNPLLLNGTGYTLTITATQGGNTAFAYLDAGNAGLGVCGAVLNAGSVNTKFPNNGTNRCNPSSDDNVTVGETLTLVFSKNVTISTLKFNNNHDGDQSLLNDTINIGGAPFTFLVGGALQDSSTTSPYNVAANTPFQISYYSGTSGRGEEFYLSALTVSERVPEPASVALLCIGMLGIVAARKHVKPALQSNR